MREHGLTLLELILALAMVGVVLLASSVLYLSTMRTTISANAAVRLQKELDSIFRDMELNLRGAVVNGGALGPASSPANYPESPLVSYEADYLWVAGRNNDDPKKEIWYGYRTNGSRELVRRICPHPFGNWGDCVEEVLSKGILFPYAKDGFDLNGDGNVDATEQTAFDNCMASPATACNSSNIKPVFEISPNRKIIYISFRGVKDKVFGSEGKDLFTSGVTKAIYIHHEGD